MPEANIMVTDQSLEDEIYITGIAGAFPDSRSVHELQECLFNKVDLVSGDERRWNLTYNVPQRGGKIFDINKFDAQFFNINYERAQVLDPVGRIMLEKTYEAIIDAGFNPRELSGQRVGMFFGNNFTESDLFTLYLRQKINQHGAPSQSRSILPVNVFEWLGVTGPCFNVDTACSSATYTIELAVNAIKEGRCDAAIAGGGSLCLVRGCTEKFYNLGVLSDDGKCKCFDKKADGYCRSETVGVVFLQKAQFSRRVYAKIIHAKTNCDGYKEQGITFPAEEEQKNLLERFYRECEISPNSVEYVEAHGTGTQVGDPPELNAIDKVFCSDRPGPLLIGSIKSNLGHAEGASGICSLAKLVIAYHTGYIPPNIHYSTPRTAVPALVEGRLKVVTEKQPWSRGLAAFSSFGFGGANAHVLLDNVPKLKVNKGLPSDDLPRLVCISGSTRSAVAKILDHLKSKTVDVDEVRLWHAIHEHNIPNHRYRGFILLASTPTSSVQIQRDIKCRRSNPRPLIVVYPGSCEVWPGGIAKSLMKLPVFNNTIQKCHDVLLNNSIDLIKILSSPYTSELNNGRNRTVTTVAVQIAITEVLRAVAIKPDLVLGDGVGELSSFYEDNTLNMQQALLAAYLIGEAFNNEGGLSSSAAAKHLESLKTISMSNNFEEFVNNLQVPNKSIKMPKNHEANAIVLEVTPCGVQEFENTYVKLPLAQKDSLQGLLVTLGKLFENGLNPHVANIYPSVQFPVAQGTSMFSHLIEWNHSEDWLVYKGALVRPKTIAETMTVISIDDDDKSFLAGHVINGHNLFPATGYLEMVWKSFASMSGDDNTEISVVFEDVSFNRATNIPKKGSLEFTISIHKETGKFEVMESEAVVVTGRIFAKKNVAASYRDIPAEANNKVQEKGGNVNLTTKDFYKELHLRGYQYKGLFRGVLGCNNYGTRGRISWKGEWVAFLDTMLQPLILAQDTRSLYVPTRIEKLSIDVDVHSQIIKNTSGTIKSFEFVSYPHILVTRTSGVELRGLHVAAISKRPVLGIPVYEKNVFVPNYGVSQMSFNDVVRLNVQIIYESLQTYKFKCLETIDGEYIKHEMAPVIDVIGDVLADMPLLQADLLVVSNENIKLPANVTVYNKNYTNDSNITLFVGANLLNRPEGLSEAAITLRHDGFIMSREKSTKLFQNLNDQWNIVTGYDTGSEYFVLIQKKSKIDATKFVRISAADKNFTWIGKVKKEIEDSNKVVLYSQNESINGLLGLINCLRKEPGGEKVYGLLIADSQAPEFSPNLEFYKEQLNKNIPLNVFKNGTWGTYRHLLLEEAKYVNSSHAYLNITTLGDLSSLRWYQGSYQPDKILKSSGYTYVHVYRSAMNFRDVMTALGRVTGDSVARGRIAQEYVQGLEVAGRTANGTRVMALCNKGYTNLALVDTTFAWPIPDEWSFSEAATVPVAYCTAYASLMLIGKMRRGESILIHAGSGAVGQAAIWVALHHGLEVFTTVGTPEKREFIKKLFPQIQDDHIGSSRNTSFEDMIRVGTSGKGVHLVLNSLADDKLLTSVRCLARRGRFLEIGKVDITNNTLIEMYQFKKEITFHSVMLDYLFEPQIYKMKKDLQTLVLSGITSGAVRPLTCCSFEKSEIEQAFRYMAAGKHIGKIVINIRDQETNVLGKPVSHPIMAIPRYWCDEDEVYVLVGGLGGFGLELADWLVLRGARRLLLCSRRGVANGYQALRIRIWSSYGADVQVCTSDITSESGCAEMLNMANSMGQVKAVFNLAVVLKDAVFENQTQESFQQSFCPKALATIYLDKLTRKLCPELKDFVVFSSVSCGRGNAGQTNYGYSNSVMERICELRKEDGLPALAIQWGAVGDVGLVADMQEENIQIEIGGTLQQRIVSCLKAMDTFLTQNDAAIVSSIVVAEKRSGSSGGGNPVDAVADAMGIKDLKTVSHQASLAELGMDSIMAVEIKQLLEREFEIFLSSQDIRNLTFSKLLEYSTENTKEVNVKGLSADYNQTINLIVKNLGDEKCATKSVVWLPTLILEKENTNLNNVPTIFMMSGIENCASTLRSLCSKLKCRACVLQLGLQHPAESLDQMADRLYPILKSKLSPGAPLYFLGYSFGTLVLLKLAAKFENEGHKVILICVDGGPEFINKIIKSVVPADSHSEDVIQVAVLERIIKITSPNVFIHDIMTEKLLKREQFEEKVIAALEMFPDNMHYSKSYLTGLATTVHNRIKLLLDNTDSLKILDQKLKSEVILIRTKVLPANVECSNDYGLGLVSDGKVTIHCLSEDHSTIIESKECANIINDVLMSGIY